MKKIISLVLALSLLLTMAVAVAEGMTAGGDVDAWTAKVTKTAGEDVELTADVIVVGAGGAGLEAASAAGEAGASVIVVEKAAAVGGNTILSGGIFNTEAKSFILEDGRVVGINAVKSDGTKVTLVEDNPENCTVIEGYLQHNGQYEVTVAHDAGSALKATRQRAFDLILLDIMLPDTDGIELCVRLRKTLFCPIIFISCLDDEETIVRAFRMGGDDYLTKPFRGAMLEAHIEAMRRRMQTVYHVPVGIYAIGDRTLHTDEHVLRRGDEILYLSPTEYELLLYFLNNEGRLLEFEQIYQYVWQKPSYGDLRTLFSHVRNLRKKLEENPAQPRHLITVPRCSYRFYARGEQP